MKQLQLVLTVDETNKVLDALSQLPFAQVHQLIGKIHETARLQLQEQEEEKSDSREKIKSIVNG